MSFNKLTLNWSSSIAAGATNSQAEKNQYAQKFIMQSVCFMAVTTAAVGSNIPAGTQFLREFPGADLAMPSLSEIELDVEIASQRVSNLPWNALLDTGDGRNPFYFQREIEVPGGGQVKCLLLNNSAVACLGRLVFNGYLA